MRNIRLMRHAMELLKGSGHPDIRGVEFFDVEGCNSPAGFEVLMLDGSSVRFRVVGTYGPAGDDFSQPETIRFPEYTIPEGVNDNVSSLRSVCGR